MNGWILSSDGPEPVVIRIAPGTTKTIGRATPADFIVEAALVSRVHCQLRVNPAGDLDVEDLGSTNGTLVNGRRIKREQLNDGDVLSVGRLELTARPQ
jgi:pSer/pThr/pTyr-binding forkhead associated (FHA) protein